MFEFLGPVLGGTAVANTIGSVVHIGDLHAIRSVTLVLAGLSGAILWNLATWWVGLPSSSSHALVGGLVGAAWAAAGSSHVVWGFQELLEHGRSRRGARPRNGLANVKMGLEEMAHPGDRLAVMHGDEMGAHDFGDGFVALD